LSNGNYQYIICYIIINIITQINKFNIRYSKQKIKNVTKWACCLTLQMAKISIAQLVLTTKKTKYEKCSLGKKCTYSAEKKEPS